MAGAGLTPALIRPHGMTSHRPDRPCLPGRLIIGDCHKGHRQRRTVRLRRQQAAHVRGPVDRARLQAQICRMAGRPRSRVGEGAVHARLPHLAARWPRRGHRVRRPARRQDRLRPERDAPVHGRGRGGRAGRGRGPYDPGGIPGPGWHTWDRGRYLAVFAREFGIRPWEIGQLDVEDFEALIDAAEELMSDR